jgi:SAM-dependent methyltransferase
MSVADVGAGRGELTVALAAEVGPGGRVYSTEIDRESLEQIGAAVATARLANVTLVLAEVRDTGLPASCCDAIVLRRVYHHLADPVATNASLLRALRPGGVLAVIDFPPLLSWLWPWPPAGVPRSRGGHGVDARLVTEEVVASGFELVQVIEDWPGRWPLASYGALFRKRDESFVLGVSGIDPEAVRRLDAVGRVAGLLRIGHAAGASQVRLAEQSGSLVTGTP